MGIIVKERLEVESWAFHSLTVGAKKVSVPFYFPFLEGVRAEGLTPRSGSLITSSTDCPRVDLTYGPWASFSSKHQEIRGSLQIYSALKPCLSVPGLGEVREFPFPIKLLSSH